MKKHLCNICDKNFVDKNALEMHNKSKHTINVKKSLLSKNQIKKIKKYLIWSILLIAIFGFFYWRSIPPNNSPIITIEPSEHNFGAVSQRNGIVNTQLLIRNDGTAPLIINNMETSCACTTASVITKGLEGPRFSMAMRGTNPKNWQTEILPGETAQLKIYYDPNTHKDLIGKVVRTVSIYSNDPRNSQKRVRIILNQVR